MIRQVIQRISNPEASIESLQERRFWLQCELAYTWQPIYQVSGRLMAVELLTVVTHPDNPSQRLPPDRYFAEITISKVPLLHQYANLVRCGWMISAPGWLISLR